VQRHDSVVKQLTCRYVCGRWSDVLRKVAAVPTAVLIVAAGRGTRAADLHDTRPKQYLPVGGVPVIARTVAAFAADLRLPIIQVVVHPDDADRYLEALGVLAHRCRPPVFGGATRQASVLAGLEALADLKPARVLVHDAARPFVTPEDIGRVLDGLELHPAAILAQPVTDTLKRADAEGMIQATVDRTGLWAAQTPQGFRFDMILAAHRKAADSGLHTFTDDAALAEWAGLAVHLVAGGQSNTKLTTPADLRLADLRLADLRLADLGLADLGLARRRSVENPLSRDRTEHAVCDVRTGTGFDVHRFADGDGVWLCGVKIPHTHKLDGHSDADVGLHALTDAILGAIGDGDIGQHFPPSDPQWKGAASHLFLRDAVRRATQRGAVITNVDVTLLCESPKITPHRLVMRTTLAEIVGIDVSRIGVKATTTEGLGFAGRREGIAAMASATVVFC
jgi:2-C-methyl-D-erythritol 4-phosphate cytidylyltransferase / 2-C-methyl-D-erythritol 2,4-cyclodiphosphate synthase